MTDPRKPIFDAIRAAKGSIAAHEVPYIDDLLDRLNIARAMAPAKVRTIGAQGIALIKRFEGCAKARGDGTFEAYPDPGTGGDPWTIGWGATGKGIARGVVWTQAQCDERLEADLVKYAAEVAKAIGDAPTTQAQFDAMVSFHYNTGAIAKAQLTKLHCAGQYTAAAVEFGKWGNAGGKRLQGLVNRRAAEAALYRENK